MMGEATTSVGDVTCSRNGSCHLDGHAKVPWRMCAFRRRHDAAVPMWLQSMLHAWPGKRGHVAEVWPVGVTSLRECPKISVGTGRSHSNAQASRHEGAQFIFWLVVTTVGKNCSSPASAASSKTCRTGAFTSPNTPITIGAIVKSIVIICSDKGLSSAAMCRPGGLDWDWSTL